MRCVRDHRPLADELTQSRRKSRTKLVFLADRAGKVNYRQDRKYKGLQNGHEYVQQYKNYGEERTQTAYITDHGGLVAQKLEHSDEHSQEKNVEKVADQHVD